MPLITGTDNPETIDGTSGDDEILGLGGADTLNGLEGDDILNGGAGADTLNGGIGNDTYVVDTAADKVIELAGGGIDTVQSSVSWILGNEIENLVLTGAAAINGVGNSLANTIIGNSAANILTGNGGADYLDGGAGADTMIGGADDDIYIVDNPGDIVTEVDGGGIDTVRSATSYVLGAFVENLVLTGNGAADGLGNALANRITGNAQDNLLTGEAGDDVLDGGAGADTLIGGVGDDTYVLDNAGDIAVENPNEGTDTVKATFSYTLDVAFENLVLLGSADIDGTGNATNNKITGNDGANVLSGLEGNDSLDGGLGADTLIGGIGDDLYYVDNAGDVVTEVAGEGTDSVIASISWTLGATFENLALTGTAAIDGTGNDGANIMFGNDGNNVLSGLGDNDTLDGGLGADTLIGGAGDDTYIVDNAGDVVTEAAGEGTDTVRSSVTWTLAAEIENLTLTGTAKIDATGNALDNVITGNRGANRIDGGAGADAMAGGAGGDTYIVDDLGDTVIEKRSEGTDTVVSSVSFTLGANVENLNLADGATSATGNELRNRINGNGAANVIDGGAGLDALDGRGGGDIYIIGNVRDHLASEINDTGAAGTDEIRLTATAPGTLIVYGGDQGIEQVTIGTGTGAVADRSGTTTLSVNATLYGAALTILGNAGANTLTGTAFNDTIDGGAGVDKLAGGKGDDVYYVDNSGDKVTERPNSGDDTVYSSASLKLGDYIETLILTGGANLNATGGNTADTIFGNTGDNLIDGGRGNDAIDGGAGNDILNGNIGSDVLTGGAGADSFRFTTRAGGSYGSDTITDFSHAEGDKIEFSRLVFRALGTSAGPIGAEQFYAAAGANRAQDKDDHLIYDTLSGSLYYDSDGTGSSAAVLVAVIGTDTHPTLDVSDFVVI